MRTLAVFAAVAAVCGVVSHVLFGFGSSWAEAAALWVGFCLLVSVVALWDRFGLPRLDLPAGTRRRPEPGPSVGPVAVELVQDEVEAELVCSLLRSDGIRCAHRQTNLSAGGFGEGNASMGGPREVIVAAKDLDRARALLHAEPVRRLR